MEDFCKVFKSEEHGQMLIIKDADASDTPAVMVKFQPKGLGICGPSFSFTDDDEDVAWGKADALFDEFDMAKSELLVEEFNRMFITPSE